MSDPYNNFIEIIREEGSHFNESPFFIGEITGTLPDIRIMCNDIELDKDNLMIDKTTLDRHNYYVSCSTGEIAHNLNDTLNIGDTVIMLKNKNTFYIISKVVSL